MTETAEIRTEVVLSEENRRLLEEISAKFDSEDEARNDPNFVLNELLKKLNEYKAKSTSLIPMTLRECIDYAHLRYVRKERSKKTA
jgi:hypothetical protein